MVTGNIKHDEALVTKESYLQHRGGNSYNTLNIPHSKMSAFHGCTAMFAMQTSDAGLSPKYSIECVGGVNDTVFSYVTVVVATTSSSAM